MTETLPSRWRSGRIARRAAVCTVPAALAVAGTVGGVAVASAAPANAATRPAQGRYGSVWQDTVTHKVHVTGFAYDHTAGQRNKPVHVALYVNGNYKRSLVANGRSYDYDKAHHIHGHHGFSAVFGASKNAKRVALVVHTVGGKHGSAVTDTAPVRKRTTDGARIVHVARKYVGSRYSYGADGPHAFDCSGYSKFVFHKAGVAKLPHNSQAQRDAKHMHAISRSHARPGDLVFYLSGNEAYHVSIYAGHGMQYSATNPRRGVEHSKISSRHVVFKTDWH